MDDSPRQISNKPRHKSFSTFSSARFKRLQQKLHTLKLQSRLKELSQSRQSPKINSNSLKILANSTRLKIYSPSRLQKTHDILKSSRFIPKVKLSLVDLYSPSSKNPSILTARTSPNSLTIFSARSESPLTYPSLIKPAFNSTKKRKANEKVKLPNDIEVRNRILFSLREETENRGFFLEPEEPPEGAGLAERLKVWDMRRKYRIERAKERLVEESMKKCTFSPKLIPRLRSSASNTSRNGSIENSYTERHYKKVEFRSLVNSKSTSAVTMLFRRHLSAVSSPQAEINYCTKGIYEKIAPINIKVSYTCGFSKKLLTKSQPMFSYSKLQFKSR